MVSPNGFGVAGVPPPCRRGGSGCWVSLAVGALLLAGCSSFGTVGLSRDLVIEQATPGSEIAYDVVKVDDAVVTALLANTPPPLHERFKEYTPAPDLKIAVGDTLAVVIWEASPEGLFGYSLRQLGSVGAAEFAQAATVGLRNPSVSAVSALPGTPGSASAANSSSGALALGNTPGGDLAAVLAARQANAAAAQQNAAAITSSITAGSLFGVGGGPSVVPSLPADATYSSGTNIPDQQVGPDGTITIPYGGQVPVVGRTPAEVQASIEQRLTGKAIEPQALVAVKRSVANTVSVSGPAVSGKRVALSPGGTRLLGVIAAAGGGRAPVHDTIVRLSRDGVTASVPLETLVADPAENIYAQPGDVLTLDRRPQTFSVFGAAGRNAAITFNSPKLNVSEALAKSGGLLDQQADPQAVFLFRYEPTAVVKALGEPIATRAPSGVSPIAYRFDLRDPKAYLLAKQFPVRDKDILFVADAKSLPVYRFFSALSNITGPIQSGFLVCQQTTC